MTPEQFRRRFTASCPPVPEDLDIEYPVFLALPGEVLDALQVREADRALLRDVGLPRDAPPFLTFEYGLVPLPVLDPRLGPVCAPFRALGHDGAGNVISVDARDGRVVLHDHDREMLEVFVNSSVLQLAAALCLYQEGRKDGLTTFLEELAAVDLKAAGIGTFWRGHASP